MIIKKSTYKTCGECNQATDRVPAVYGCDRCGKTLDNADKLELQVYGKNMHDDRDGYVFEGSKTFNYCNWYCLMLDLPSRDDYDFIAFPALYPNAMEEFLDACRF